MINYTPEYLSRAAANRTLQNKDYKKPVRVIDGKISIYEPVILEGAARKQHPDNRNNVKELIDVVERLNLTPEQLAEMIGGRCTVQSVKKYLNGTVPFRSNRMRDLKFSIAKNSPVFRQEAAIKNPRFRLSWRGKFKIAGTAAEIRKFINTEVNAIKIKRHPSGIYKLCFCAKRDVSQGIVLSKAFDVESLIIGFIQGVMKGSVSSYTIELI